MARRPSQPALYELIRDRGMLVTRAPIPAPEAAPTPGDAPPIAARTLRVPVGYVWVAIAGAVAALVVSYIVGYSAGGNASRLERLAELERGAGGVLPVDDPLGGPGSERRQVEDTLNQGSPSGKADGKSSASTPSSASGRDPRVPGSTYFVVARPDPERAAELVAFVRGEGLDAHLVRDQNGALRKVIALPGYASAAERSSREIKELETRIRAIGLRWKNHARGNRDFGDAYPELYKK